MHAFIPDYNNNLVDICSVISVQASIAANTWVVSGSPQTKSKCLFLSYCYKFLMKDVLCIEITDEEFLEKHFYAYKSWMKKALRSIIVVFLLRNASISITRTIGFS